MVVEVWRLSFSEDIIKFILIWLLISFSIFIHNSGTFTDFCGVRKFMVLSFSGKSFENIVPHSVKITSTLNNNTSRSYIIILFVPQSTYNIFLIFSFTKVGLIMILERRLLYLRNFNFLILLISFLYGLEVSI